MIMQKVFCLSVIPSRYLTTPDGRQGVLNIIIIADFMGTGVYKGG